MKSVIILKEPQNEAGFSGRMQGLWRARKVK